MPLEAGRRVFSRVVLVDVDVVQGGLLQAEDVNHGSVQDVVGLCEKLVEAPTLLLIRLQDVGEDGGQQALKTPEGTWTSSRVLDSPTKFHTRIQPQRTDQQ